MQSAGLFGGADYLAARGISYAEWARSGFFQMVGEEVMIEFTDMYRQAKREGWSKEEFLRKVCHIPGVYVPSLYEVTYNEDGTVKAVTPKDGAPAFVQKRHSSNTAV